MGENLRPKTGHGRELTDVDGRRAIDDVPVRDGRLRAENQFRHTVLLVSEERFVLGGKTGDPVATTDAGVRTHMQAAESFAHRLMAIAGVFAHDQLFRIHE